MAINWKVLFEVKVKKPVNLSTKGDVVTKSAVPMIDLSTELENYFKPKEVSEEIKENYDVDVNDVIALIDFKSYSWKDRDKNGKNDTICYNNIPVLKDDYRAIGGIAHHILEMWKDEWKELCYEKEKKR